MITLRVSGRRLSKSRKIEGQTDAEGVERFLQIDADAAGWRRTATRTRRVKSEGLSVGAEISVPVLGPSLPSRRDLCFPARADRAAQSRVAPVYRGRCRTDRGLGGAGGGRGWRAEASDICKRSADFSERDAARHVQETPGRDKNAQAGAD